MLHAMSGWQYSRSSGAISLLTAAIFVLFVVFLLPRQAAIADRQLGEGPSPDTSFLYSASDLHEMAESFGADGRSAYLRSRWTFDVVWPLVYLAFLATSSSWVLGGVLGPRSRLRLLNLLAPAAAALDILENIVVSVVIFRYPADSPAVAWAAGPITAAKWLFVGASFMLLVVGMLALLIRRAPFDRPWSVG